MSARMAAMTSVPTTSHNASRSRAIVATAVCQPTNIDPDEPHLSRAQRWTCQDHNERDVYVYSAPPLIEILAVFTRPHT
jgi:hypothetical protein